MTRTQWKGEGPCLYWKGAFEKNNLGYTYIAPFLVPVFYPLYLPLVGRTMPTSASANTLRATAASSPAYARLWKGLATHAVQPALSHQVGQSKATGTSRRKQRGGRKSTSASRNAGAPSAAFGQKEFVAEWSQSIHELMKANRTHAERKQQRRSSKHGNGRRSGGRSSTKQRGGFVRDGSVQYFPADSGCRAQMAGHSN